jgi:hypothetical protein
MARSLKVTLALIAAVGIGLLVAFGAVTILLGIDLWRRRR